MPKKTILVDNKTVVVENDVILTKNDFYQIIKVASINNSTSISYITINTEIYSDYSKTPGEYLVDYNIVTTSGLEYDGVFITKVVETRSNGAFIDTPKEQQDGFIVSILKWIWSLIVSAFNWFMGLFK